MMKMAGALLIVGATSLWGIRKATKFKTQVNELRYLQKILCRIQSEIRYSRIHLGEIFWNLGREVKEPYKSWLLEMSERMKSFSGDSFENIWKMSIDNNLKILELPKYELDGLKTLGNQLGFSDVQVQIRLIDLYIEHLERTIGEMHEEMQNKVRVYYCLGIMSGLFVAVLLF